MVGDLSDPEASTLPKQPANANSGQTWLEGIMNWTRYNHVLPPGRKSCINGLTWNGVAMTAGGRHRHGVNLRALIRYGLGKNGHPLGIDWPETIAAGASRPSDGEDVRLERS